MDLFSKFYRKHNEIKSTRTGFGFDISHSQRC